MNLIGDMRMTGVLAFLALAASQTSAFHGELTPCHMGECSYNIPASQSSMAAKRVITGSSSAISDITAAAGWEVLNCSPGKSAQEVRIVCTGDELVCSHVFQDGAEHTIVRLPNNCGIGHFARVSRAWISEDQSILLHVRSRMRKRNGKWPSVHAFSMDTDFSKASNSNKGNVSFTIYGSTNPQFTYTTTPISHARRHARDISSRENVDDSDVFDVFSAFSASDSGVGTFIRNTTQNSIPINIDEYFNIFNTTLSCAGKSDAKLSIDAAVNMRGEIDLGVVAQGTIMPPKIDKLGLFATMSADLYGTLSVSSGIFGQIDLPESTFLTVSLPGLSVPDVISLGPSISLAAKATVDVDVDLNIDVGFGYSISHLVVFLPPSAAHNSTAVVAAEDIPLELSVSPGVKSETSFTAHLIPAFNFGLIAFGVETAAVLNFDTSATLELDLSASASGDVDSTGLKNTASEVEGCVDAKGGVAVNLGLEANSPFFDLLGNSATISLAGKDFDFFQRCFPDSSGTPSASTVTPVIPIEMRDTSPKRNDGLHSRTLGKRGFSCLPTTESVQSTTVNETLSSAGFIDA